MVVEQYMNENTKIRIHDDYISTKEEDLDIKNTILAIILDKLQDISNNP